MKENLLCIIPITKYFILYTYIYPFKRFITITDMKTILKQIKKL